MVTAKTVLGWVLVCILSMSSTQTARACAFHGYTPDPTLVDFLLGTEHVVIARLSPLNAGQYVPVETLLGYPVTEVAAAVSRKMGKRLRGNPSATMLLARDGAYGPWVEVAVLDDSYRILISEVVAQQSPWLFGADEERLAFFAKRLNHPNTDIRHLALRELDRAAYADLQRVRIPMVQNLRRDLTSGERELRPILILLAGLSGDAGFVQPLSLGMDKAFAADTPYLGAYVTALIELGGGAAVENIVQQYLMSKRASGQRMEKVMQALALQYKSAPRATRRVIAHEVAVGSRRSPEVAEVAARHFGFESGGRFARP